MEEVKFSQKWHKRILFVYVAIVEKTMNTTKSFTADDVNDAFISNAISFQISLRMIGIVLHVKSLVNNKHQKLGVFYAHFLVA